MASAAPKQSPEKTEMLDALAAEWQRAKARERVAKQDMARIEEGLLRLANSRDEGTEKILGSNYKITITYRMNRTLDQKAWAEIAPSIPENLRPIKPALDVTGVKYLRDNEPEIYAQIAPALTTKPGKPGFKIEDII